MPDYTVATVTKPGQSYPRHYVRKADEFGGVECPSYVDAVFLCHVLNNATEEQLSAAGKEDS